MEIINEPADPQRYEHIDERNRASWYMDEAQDRPFDVIQSIHSAGRPRVDPKDTPVPYSIDFQRELNRAALTILEQKKKGGRFVLGGNMSPVVHENGKVPYGPKAMTDEERFADAEQNMMRHFEQIGVDPAMVRVLYPDRDYTHGLGIVNVDEDDSVCEGGVPIRLKKQGDFIYTYNPDIVLAVRPADCPIAIIAAETPKGQITMLVHFAWRGPATGEYEDMKRAFADLGVDNASMRVYITAGGHSETFGYPDPYKPNDADNKPSPVGNARLFKDVKAHGDPNDPSYTFGIDTVNDVYEEFLSMGIDEHHIFVDTTDTTAPESGTASNSRAVNYGDDNVRDIVTVQTKKGSLR
jgi:copper oxidase (laccase) domain-containing protein